MRFCRSKKTALVEIKSVAFLSSPKRMDSVSVFDLLKAPQLFCTSLGRTDFSKNRMSKATLF